MKIEHYSYLNKFRIWDKQAKKFIEKFPEELLDIIKTKGFNEVFFPNDRYVFMQLMYNGHTQTDGSKPWDIYQGDIILTRKRGSAFENCDKDGFQFGHRIIFVNNKQDIPEGCVKKVIGNYLENPDLLTYKSMTFNS